MRILIIVLGLLIATNCYAALYHYTDKATGEERGICYSDSPIDNPSWNSEIIQESQKKELIALQQKQMNEKPKKPSLEDRVSAIEKKLGL